jgi:hypothetical protein
MKKRCLYLPITLETRYMPITIGYLDSREFQQIVQNLYLVNLYVRSRCSADCKNNIIYCASEKGCLDVVKYLIGQGRI